MRGRLFCGCLAIPERFDAGRLSPVQNGRDGEGLARFRPGITSAPIRLGMTGNRPGVRGPDGEFTVLFSSARRKKKLNSPGASPADERRPRIKSGVTNTIKSGVTNTIGSGGDARRSSPG